MIDRCEYNEIAEASRPMPWLMHVLAFAILLVVPSIALAVELTPADIENRRCLNCHGQSHIADLNPSERASMIASYQPAAPIPSPSPITQPAPTTQPFTPTTGPAPEKRPGLFLPGSIFSSSVHAKLACVDCHQNARALPHARQLGPAVCSTSCHAKAQSDYLQGAHAEAIAKGDTHAPTCASCHGGHDIFRKSDRQSKVNPLNIVKICANCHEKHTGNTPAGHNEKAHIQNYLDSVHGRAVAGGLAVSATCADCHSNHRVLPSKNPLSTVNRDHVATTCGQCHTGVLEIYAGSIHGQRLAKADPKAPVCTDCHTAHGISRTDTPAFKLDIVNECGSCHDKAPPGSPSQASLYDTFRRSYHGQVADLGSARAARCSDCHGAHDIRPVSDPVSRLHAENRVQTCRKCHPDATAKFAEFQAHADHRDAEHYPLLHAVWLYFVVMMSFSFGFFGLHCIFWFLRSAVERIKHGPHPKHTSDTHAIQRFTRTDRINHALVIISFFGLTLTGLPLLYAEQGWARSLVALFGGVRAAGLWHRFFALMLIGNFVIHGVGVFRRIKKHSLKAMLFGPTTMLPRWKDVTDCIGMFRWFFLGGKKPAFDRWTYWEKFDYTAEVGGSGIIALTGLMLWFPQFFANFMPGWMFNVATLIHGYEATLAIGFIFTIHFFNAHLRMEKFPVDDVMFTGRLPEGEFKEERGAEYERLVRTGQLEALRVAPAPKWYRMFAVIMGITAMAIGTTLVILIILAGLKVL